MKLIVLLCLLIASSAQAWTQRPPEQLSKCSIHAPYGLPVANPKVNHICRQAYLVGYDVSAKLPRYVTYTLTPPNALGCFARTNAFVADESIVNGAHPDDYVGTGYDKGHMVPDGDLSWDQQVEYESFLMTNMAPQAGSLNRGIWKSLETSIRGWAVQSSQPHTIYVGGIYGANNKKIGDGVVVPHAYYKIVINNQTKEFAAWLFPHIEPYPNLGNDLTRFRLPINQIQKLANVQFKLPKNAKELDPRKEWDVDFGDLTKAKRAKCTASAERIELP